MSYYDSGQRRYNYREDDKKRYYGHSNNSYSSYGDSLNRTRKVPGIVDDPEDHRYYHRDHRERRRDERRHHSHKSSRSANRPKRSSSLEKMTVERYDPKVTTTNTYSPYNTGSRKLKTENHSSIFPNFLGVFTGVCGFGLLLAAVILASWLENFLFSNNQMVSIGLFTVCTLQTETLSTNCQSREEFSNSGLQIAALEQATRSLVIIAIIISFVGALASVFLGIKRFRLHYGCLITGGIYLLAAMCAVAGMGCYSGFIGTQPSVTNQLIQAGTAFHLGWFGAACLIVSSIISFLSHFIH